jgi:hypothetical protein
VPNTIVGTQGYHINNRMFSQRKGDKKQNKSHKIVHYEVDTIKKNTAKNLKGGIMKT